MGNHRTDYSNQGTNPKQGPSGVEVAEGLGQALVSIGSFRSGGDLTSGGRFGRPLPKPEQLQYSSVCNDSAVVGLALGTGLYAHWIEVEKLLRSRHEAACRAGLFFRWLLGGEES